VKFGRDDIVKLFLKSGRPGFYFSVLKEGEVEASTAIELVARDHNNITVGDIARLYVSDKENTELMRRAVAVEALPASWRNYFSKRLER
jgi:MOSC domain-containing protein YiiM